MVYGNTSRHGQLACPEDHQCDIMCSRRTYVRTGSGNSCSHKEIGDVLMDFIVLFTEPAVENGREVLILMGCA